MTLPRDEFFGGDRTCGRCSYHRATEDEEEDFVACVCPVEENPIWAIRKFSRIGMRDAEAYKGTHEYLGQDPGKMRSDDGVACEAFVKD